MSVVRAQRANRFTVFMEQNLDVALYGPENCMCRCPFCDGKSSLSFNDVKGVWLCFRCSEKGTAKTLAEKLGGRYAEPEVELEQLSAELRLLERDAQPVRRHLAESYLSRFHRPGRVHEYWAGRGFGAGTCDRWELGYDFLSNRAALPFRDPFTGGLAGVFFRRMQGAGLRYQYPKGFSSGRALYGSWLLADSPARSVLLVEGPTDALRVDTAGLHVASQYGSHLSEAQVRLLHRLGVKELVFFHDCDPAGQKATREAAEAADGFALSALVWDGNEYCPHPVVCRCRFHHTPGSLGQCGVRKPCPCSRKHNADPGGLTTVQILDMYNNRKVRVTS